MRCVTLCVCASAAGWQADPGHGDLADAGGRREDAHHGRAGRRAQLHRQEGGDRGAGAVARAGVRHQGWRRRRRLLSGGPNGGPCQRGRSNPRPLRLSLPPRRPPMPSPTAPPAPRPTPRPPRRAYQQAAALGLPTARPARLQDINLHFTGDFGAIGLAHNLLAAMLDNHSKRRRASNPAHSPCPKPARAPPEPAPPRAHSPPRQRARHRRAPRPVQARRRCQCCGPRSRGAALHRLGLTPDGPDR